MYLNQQVEIIFILYKLNRYQTPIYSNHSLIQLDNIKMEQHILSMPL
jgi:hypothetical protein